MSEISNLRQDLKLWHERAQYWFNRCSKLEKQNEKLKELLLSVMDQACGDSFDFKNDRVLFDSLCLSSYENALHEMVAMGLIKQEQVIR